MYIGELEYTGYDTRPPSLRKQWIPSTLLLMVLCGADCRRLGGGAMNRNQAVKTNKDTMTKEA